MTKQPQMLRANFAAAAMLRSRRTRKTMLLPACDVEVLAFEAETISSLNSLLNSSASSRCQALQASRSTLPLPFDRCAHTSLSKNMQPNKPSGGGLCTNCESTATMETPVFSIPLATSGTTSLPQGAASKMTTQPKDTRCSHKGQSIRTGAICAGAISMEHANAGMEFESSLFPLLNEPDKGPMRFLSHSECCSKQSLGDMESTPSTVQRRVLWSKYLQTNGHRAGNSISTPPTSPSCLEHEAAASSASATNMRRIVMLRLLPAKEPKGDFMGKRRCGSA
mmetsp:Transcript_60035/g.167506  ORF Transcript_60035/g.167506 Transcript_60035/m.167506 type:complete len:280 (+) Transcript_60035:768-1607(+)